MNEQEGQTQVVLKLTSCKSKQLLSSKSQEQKMPVNTAVTIQMVHVKEPTQTLQAKANQQGPENSWAP